VAACRQRKRVRFTTAAEMVTELIEAKNQLELTRVRNRWTRYDLIVIDELGYVVMPDAAAELLFQVIAGRAERAAVIVTTNLPFSEWTTKFPNARLCKAMLDRLPSRSYRANLLLPRTRTACGCPQSGNYGRSAPDR
jgi:DNA replication protein DnaC